MDNSGYIKVNINDETIGFRFGIPANRMFIEKLLEFGIEISPDGNVNEVGVSTLLHCGYLNNCLVQDEEPKHKRGFFIEYVERAFIDAEIKETLTSITECYRKSKFTEKLTEQVISGAEEAKKKSQ